MIIIKAMSEAQTLPGFLKEAGKKVEGAMGATGTRVGDYLNSVNYLERYHGIRERGNSPGAALALTAVEFCLPATCAVLKARAEGRDVSSGQILTGVALDAVLDTATIYAAVTSPDSLMAILATRVLINPGYEAMGEAIGKDIE